jgi:hypothetical protein
MFIPSPTRHLQYFFWLRNYQAPGFEESVGIFANLKLLMLTFGSNIPNLKLKEAMKSAFNAPEGKTMIRPTLPMRISSRL